MKNNLISQNSNFLNAIKEPKEIYITVKIADLTYAIKTSEISEIIKVIELDFPNNLPTCVVGIIRFDNKPIAVVDLREIQKKERIVYNLDSEIVILKTETTTISIICDKVVDVRKLAKEKIHPVPFGNKLDFIEGLYINQNENIYILKPENLTSYIEKNQEFFINQNPNELFLVNDENSREILKDRKNFLIKDIQEIQTNKELYDMGVSFIINNIKYYINMASVKEFHKINNLKIIKIPSTPDYIFGLINIKGDYITILDIRKFFNNSKTELKEKSTLIIINSNEFKIGILADEICENININFEEIIQNRLQKEDNKMLEFVKDGEIYQVIDVEKLLQDERLTIA